jgi:hypothetical protein
MRAEHGRFATLVTLTSVLVWTTIASAQTGPVTAENGFQPNRDYLALQPFEAIDTASGNVVLTFTDLELPGNNGRSLSFTRVFNNTLLGPGQSRWHFSIAGVPLQVTHPNPPSVGSTILPSIDGERSRAPRFRMPDGSHQFTTFLNSPDTSTTTSLNNTTRWVSTPDFWRYDWISRVLDLPDGRSASRGRSTAVCRT